LSAIRFKVTVMASIVAKKIEREVAEKQGKLEEV
jgi:hypothetical protein